MAPFVFGLVSCNCIDVANWPDTELVQTIAHPSMSLWSTAAISAGNGTAHYIASSSADSNIRFFTQSEDLVASAEDLAAWDQEVSQRKLDK
jgi:phospholipase A-2-activating protein